MFCKCNPTTVPGRFQLPAPLGPKTCHAAPRAIRQPAESSGGAGFILRAGAGVQVQVSAGFVLGAGVKAKTKTTCPAFS